MAALTWLLISAVISISTAQMCPAERADPIRSYEAQIHELLLSKDCAIDHPLVLDPSKVLKVKVHFFLKYFEFDQAEEIFSINSWVALVWINPYLTWNPDDFGGIGDVLVHSIDIWTPSLDHLNAADSFLGEGYFGVLCSVFSDGKVVCIPRMKHDVICTSKLGNWPYDTQKCQLKFGTNDVLGPKINFTFDTTKAVTIGGAEKSAGWMIQRYTYRETRTGANSTNALYIDFFLQRTAEDIAVMLITPSIVIAVLTVTALMINVTDNVRLGLLCFNLLNHFYLLQDISNSLPNHSVDTPTILSLVCGLMIVNVSSLILTILFNKLCLRESSPKSAIVSKVNEFMDYGMGRYMNLTQWETNEGDSKVKVNKDWLGFCNFINSVCLFAILFAYLLLFICYVPTKLRNL